MLHFLTVIIVLLMVLTYFLASTTRCRTANTMNGLGNFTFPNVKHGAVCSSLSLDSELTNKCDEIIFTTKDT